MKPSKAVEEIVNDFYSISPKHRTKERLVKELTTFEAKVREKAYQEGVEDGERYEKTSNTIANSNLY